jgi:putative acetyltransferase
MNVSIKRISGDEADHLLVQSDRYMAALYPAESNHLVSSASLRGRHALFLGAFTGQANVNTAANTCIACVAARFYQAAGYAEIKRLFVDEGHRGHSIARTLMVAIEEGIVAEGINCARLEMGIYQPEATALYQSMGYRLIAPFGDYQLDPLSQFLEKKGLSIDD